MQVKVVHKEPCFRREMMKVLQFVVLAIMSVTALAQDMTAARRNVLLNGSFARDLSRWNADWSDTAVPQWSMLDGRNDAHSGAAELRSGALGQCVGAAPITNYRYGAKVHVEGQAKARIEVLFLSTENCARVSEQTIVASDSQEITPSEGWRAVVATVPSAPEARSALVRMSIDATDGGEGRALFDDVFLTPTTKLTATRIKPEQLDQVVEGMTFAEVVRLLGAPMSMAKDGDGSLATYNYDTVLYHRGQQVTNLCAYAELSFDKAGRLTKKAFTAK